jgi:DNA-binding NarL/FixJ family response regulator
MGEASYGYFSVMTCVESSLPVLVLTRFPLAPSYAPVPPVTATVISRAASRMFPAYEALRAGTSGFLLKAAPPEQLVAAVRTVAEGDALLAPAVTQRVIEAFAQRGPPPEELPSALDELTARELEVLRHLARGESNAEIARAFVVEESTVKTHVARVLMKLGLRDRVQAVVYAYESGLVHAGEQSSRN